MKNQKRNIRTSANHQLAEISTRLKEKNIITSASLPFWNLSRLKAAAKTLTRDLGHHFPEYKIALVSMQLLQRKLCGAVPLRATYYNQTACSYDKFGIVFKKHGDYARLRMTSLAMRSSLSQLFDIALRLYLSLAVRIIFLNEMGITLKEKWNGVVAFCNYIESNNTTLLKNINSKRKEPD